METKSNSLVTIPGAIIIAGAFVAIAIIWTHKAPPSAVANTAGANQAAAVANAKVPDVSGSDHILGNPNAPVKIIEYSDPSCPYCKAFYPTMTKVMQDYGASGKVAWIYRSFPLDKPDENGNVLHPNAGHESQALECAAALGGNDKFWAFANRLYDITPSVTSESPQGLDQNQLPEIARFVGLDVVSFNDCLSSGQYKNKVEKQYLDGLNAGISGTPYSFIVTPSGSQIPLVGAQPYATVKSAIDTILSDPSAAAPADTSSSASTGTN